MQRLHTGLHRGMHAHPVQSARELLREDDDRHALLGVRGGDLHGGSGGWGGATVPVGLARGMAYRLLDPCQECLDLLQLRRATPRACRDGGCMQGLELSVVEAQRAHGLEVDELLRCA